ncbi:hypothetical protein COOONC_07412 [Cooperia oncophora]
MFDGGHESSDDGDEHNDENALIRRNDGNQGSSDRESPDEFARAGEDVNLQLGIRNGVRQFLRILNARVRNGNNRAMDAAMRDLDSSEEESFDEEDGASSEGNGSAANPNFDVQLQLGIRNGVRQFLRILNARVRNGNNRAMDAAMRDLDSSEEESFDEEDGASSEGNGSAANPNFDVQVSSMFHQAFW